MGLLMCSAVPKDFNSASPREQSFSSVTKSCLTLCSPIDYSTPGFSVLYRAHLCTKYSFGISDFLEEIPSLSHSVVFLYFFALIAEGVGNSYKIIYVTKYKFLNVV